MQALPSLVDELCARWALQVHHIYEPASVAFVAMVSRVQHGNTVAVLKINFPDEETRLEADALRWWGKAVPQVYDVDKKHRALLLSSVDPGTKLWDANDVDEDGRTNVVAGVLARLFERGSSSKFRHIREDCARWATMALPFEPKLVDEFRRSCAELPETMKGRDLVVCHQDLHGGNILAQCDPGDPWAPLTWVAIDPKPVLAERAFDVASYIRDQRATITRDVVIRRLDKLSEELELNRDRARRWALVHALAWAGVDGEDEKFHEAHVQVARWLLDA